MAAPRTPKNRNLFMVGIVVLEGLDAKRLHRDIDPNPTWSCSQLSSELHGVTNNMRRIAYLLQCLESKVCRIKYCWWPSTSTNVGINPLVHDQFAVRRVVCLI